MTTPWLIEGILPRTGIGLLVGPSGHGKTFLVLDWLCSVHTGHAWLQRPVTQGHGVYLAGYGVQGLSQRFEAWELTHPLAHDLTLSLVDGTVDLLDATSVVAFIAETRIAGITPAFLVMDELTPATLGADREDPTVLQRVVHAIRTIQEAFACFVLLVDHLPIEDTPIASVVDVAIAVRKDQWRLTVQCARMRDAAAFAPLHLVTQEVPLVSDPTRTSLVLTEALV